MNKVRANPPKDNGMSFSLSSLFGSPDEDDEIDNSFNDEQSYSWSVEDYGFEYSMVCYCIQKAVKELDKKCYVYQNASSGDFQYDLDKNQTIITTGIITFNYKKKNYTLTFNVKASTITLAGNNNIYKVKKYFDDWIKDKNPLRRKNIQIFSRHGDLQIAYHPIPDLPYDKLVLSTEIKEDIYDNTILHLQKLKQNNGVIFYGKPGLGKTSCAKSLIYEAIKLGFSSCTVTSNVGFTTLGIFLKSYISPALVLFEDVDSYASSRLDKDNPEIADFLQLLNGISDNKDGIVYIASTNHIEFLDDAIKSRPCRINRRYQFNYPAPHELSQIIDLYFGLQTISDKQKEECNNCNFGGAHVAELKRTCDILCIKNNKTLSENWDEGLKVVKKNFAIPKSCLGFKGFAQGVER
jgi:hypothetical protein